MKILKSLPLMLLLFTFFQQAFADPGRITSPADPNMRCVKISNINPTCDQRRSRALKYGCITEGEKRALDKYNSYPYCDSYFEGLDQLIGWCPCEIL